MNQDDRYDLVVAGCGVGGTARDLAVVSFEPGMVDTPMQEENRSASPEDLPDVAVFRKLHEDGLLSPPEQVAGAVADLLERDDLPRHSEVQFVKREEAARGRLPVPGRGPANRVSGT